MQGIYIRDLENLVLYSATGNFIVRFGTISVKHTHNIMIYQFTVTVK